MILATALPLFGGNSIFSYQGTPCQNFGNDIYGMTMGDVGLSDVFRTNTGYGNPAILGSVNKTLFSTGIKYGWTNYTSDNGIERTFKDNSLDFPFFSISVPINQNHFGFQFNSMASGVVQNQITTALDSITFTERQSIDRYIYRADLMYAYHFSHINIGAALNYYFGHDIRKFYQSSGFGIFNTSEILERSYKNPTATVGITAEYGKFAWGAYYTNECTLDGSVTRSSIHETEELDDIKYSVPTQVATGFTLKFAEEYKVSSDFVASLWKNAKHSEYDKDSWKLGIGLAMEPSPNINHSWFGSIPKRAGFSYRSLPFDVNGNPVSETALTAGFTLPLKQGNNHLDFGVEYLMRGNVDENNLQDRSLMFMLGITGFDILSKPFTRNTPREIPKTEEISE